MKIKRFGFVIVLVVLLVLGWGLSVRKVSGADIINEQNRIITIGDQFVKRELYIRAIPAYEDVLKMGPANEKILRETQVKLLNAYEEIGDYESYRKMAESRIADKVATEEEYIKVVNMYIAQYSMDDAFQYMKAGIDNLGESEALHDMYEDYRYSFDIKHTTLVDILPTEGNGTMPAYDGNAWGFVNRKGKAVIPYMYEQVSMLNSNGLAVVCQDGVYYTINTSNLHWSVNDGDYKNSVSEIQGLDGDNVILKVGDKYSVFTVDFKSMTPDNSYEKMTPISSSRRFVYKNSEWKLVDSDWKEVEGSEAYDEVALNSLGRAFSGGVATVRKGNEWFIINTDGQKLTAGYSNAKAPESNGYIAVCDNSGKWGYINQQGEEVIKCEYYDALSFSDGLGAVKLFNDEWVYISIYGKQVISGTFIGAKPFHSGAAQVNTIDGAAMVVLEYKEY